jgi:hypothetical protein
MAVCVARVSGHDLSILFRDLRPFACHRNWRLLRLQTDDWVPKFQMSFHLGDSSPLQSPRFILNDQFRSGYSDNQGQAMAKAAILEWNQNPKIEITNADPLTLRRRGRQSEEWSSLSSQTSAAYIANSPPHR